MNRGVAAGDDLYRQLFEEAVEAIVVLDPATLLPVAFNAKALALVGTTREAFAAVRFADLFPQDQQHLLGAQLAASLFNGTAEFFSYLALPEKDRRTVRVSLHSVGSGEERRLHVFIHDLGQARSLEEAATEGWAALAATNQQLSAEIEQRRKAERQLQQANEEWQRTFDASSDPIMVLDTSFRVLRINRAMAELLGMPAEAAVGQLCCRLMHLQDEPVPDCPHCQLLEDGQAHTSEFFLPHFGRYFLITVSPLRDPAGVLIGSVHYAKDITERKAGEEALRESERFILSIIDTLDAGLAVIDRQYRIKLANRAYSEIFGCRPQEMSGRHCYQVMTGEEIHCTARGLDCPVKRTFETGLPQSLVRHSRAPGELGRTVEIKTFPLKDEDGQVGSVIEVAVDVTDRLHLAEHRQRAQKLEAIGTLAGGIAHDFNNLLQGVFGYLSLARGNLDQREKADHFLTQAEQALNTSINLTHQLLTFAKGGLPAKKTLCLPLVLESAARFALSGTPSDYRLEIADDLWPVDADEGQFRQVVQNLVMNANEAMPGGGRVTIVADNRELPAGDHPLLREGGRYVRIVVRDGGVGIPKEHLPRIFDPYFSTKQQGSGLGLATAFSIVRNHGGTLDVNSRPGEGSEFVIHLPAGDGGPKSLERGPEDPPATISGRVLVMDDEDLVREVVAEMVTGLGHEVVVAADGGEALDQFRAARDEGRPFNVVILDLTVKGGMGGEQTIGELRALDPQVKAVVASGYADNPVVANYRDYGFVAVLKKPFRLDVVQQLLDDLLR